MSRLVIAAAVLIAPFVLTAPATAEEVDLVGTWTATSSNNLTWRGTRVPLDDHWAEIEITSHDGPIFSGVLRWGVESHEHGLDDGEKHTIEAEENLLGVLNHDGETYTVVEHPDTTIRQFRLTDANTIETVTYETGPNAVVGRVTYVRQ